MHIVIFSRSHPPQVLASQMKILFSPPLILIPLINILCLFSTNNNFVGAVDQLFQNCSVSRFCGSQLISFPFYTEEEHKHCGFPGFHLSCNYSNGGNPIAILNLHGDDYVVHKIFYENQSLIVSNVAFSTSNTACFPHIGNLSLPAEFTLASDEINSKVFLIQNCTSSSDLLEYKIGCSAGNDSKWVLALPEKDEKKVGEASEKCGIESNEVLKLPVMEYNNEEEMREVLSRGFMLNWTASDCTLCNSTGGKCGFEYDTYHFKCFCPDRPHAARCYTPDPSYEACEPRNCGTDPDISYPFHFEGNGEASCCLKVLRIACPENKPVFRTSRGPIHH